MTINLNTISKIHRVYLIIFFLLILSSFALSLKFSIVSENFIDEVIDFYIYVYTFIIFQAIFLFFILARVKSEFTKILIFSFLLFLNFYFLIMSTSAFFTNVTKGIKITYLVLCFLILTTLIKFIFTKIKILKIFCLLYVFLNFYYLFDFQSYFQNNSNNIKTTIDFSQKRNFYIYSFESFIPNSIIKKHLGLDVNIDSLEKNENFFIIKNNFADFYPTKQSINSILYLDPVKWRKNKITKKSYFTGEDKSPLFEIFKHNGYKIITGFKYPTMGKVGKFIDEYYTENSVNLLPTNFSFCYGKANRLNWFYFQLYGYCEFKSLTKKAREINKKLNIKDFHDFAIQQIDKGSIPTLKWFHMIPYDHPDSINKDYTKIFNKGVYQAVHLIEKIIKRVNDKDPNSVVVIFGDHNLMTWRFSSDIKLNKYISDQYNNFEDYKFMDSLPVFGGIYDNSNFCFESIKNLKLEKFTTNSKIVNKIIACYAGRNSLFSEPIIYNFYGLDYQNYIYE